MACQVERACGRGREAFELADLLAGEIPIDSDLVGQRMLLDLGAINRRALWVRRAVFNFVCRTVGHLTSPYCYSFGRTAGREQETRKTDHF